jgi:exonuclease VII small subunit
MIKAEYIGESPSIDIERTKWERDNQVTITISEFEICLDEADAKELLDGLEETLILWEDTRSGLESKIEDLNEEIENLTAALKEYEEGGKVR